MKRFDLVELTGRVSWGSIFGGVMTVLAISILLSILSSSIGLFMFDPMSEHPTSGIGTTVGIGSAIALIVSMIAGGFIAGKLAGVDGLVHGFLVWATTLIVAAILGTMLTISAAKLTANVLGSVSSVAGNVVSGAGSIAGNTISALSDQAKEVFDKISFKTDMNTENIPANIRTVLSKSDVKELQPDYLQKQLDDVKADLNKSIKSAIAFPQNADKILEGFMERLKNRADKISQNIDRNDLAKTIANNTNLSKAEANKAIEQYMNIINNATTEAKQQIDNLEITVQKAVEEWNDIKHKALIAADEATDAAASSALISFFAILIAAILCSLAGSFGSKKTKERVDL